jgi:hypothetical protein
LKIDAKARLEEVAGLGVKRSSRRSQRRIDAGRRRLNIASRRRACRVGLRLHEPLLVFLLARGTLALDARRRLRRRARRIRRAHHTIGHRVGFALV